MRRTGYCYAAQMLELQRVLLAPDYTAYVRQLLAKKHYGKTRKYRK